MNTFYKLISSTAGLFEVKIIFAQNNRVVLVLNMMKDEYIILVKSLKIDRFNGTQ